MKAAVYTLGCKVNQVETEAIKESLIQDGYEIVDFPEAADVFIINTCAVTQIADKKSRAVIRRARRINPLARVVVTGCYSQVFREQIESMGDIDLIIPNKDKEDLAGILKQYISTGQAANDSLEREDKLQAIKYSERHHRTRAFVKIEDGCESWCTYCIVPQARGRIRSKHPEDVLSEIQGMLDLGYREIVLTGIHIGQYGRDLEKWELVTLLEFLLYKLSGTYRLRLGSIEVSELNVRLRELITGDRRLCRHLHIPLQSGSDKILHLMNRHYSSRQYLDLLQTVADNLPGIGLTTDVMVGFPGEGETEWHETVSLIEGSPLNDLHVFRFSPRPGTRAATFSGTVSNEIKNFRSRQLIDLGERKRYKFMKSLVGGKTQVLTEKRVDGVTRGLSDNYVEVDLEDQVPLNTLFNVGIQQQKQQGTLAGVILDENMKI
ncbi:MAG: tRNA (N(6)-L-threonylcarbamoyladenosine(37)-C(2))-methylthiotransferase MtaB [Chitinophagales bacterium]